MNETARIYRAEILRAMTGNAFNTERVHDLHRLNRLCEHLAECEHAQTILRAKGHGTAGTTFVDLAHSVPDSIPGKIKSMFHRTDPKPIMVTEHGYPDIGELHDIWGVR
jgi:hypothetical protein